MDQTPLGPQRPGRGLPPIVLAGALAVVLGALAYGGSDLFDRLTKGWSAAGPATSADLGTILRIGGSSTIGDKLGPALAEGWLKSLGCPTVTRSSTDKDETVLTCNANGKNLKITVASHGTETGFKGLQDGSYDLAQASDQIDDATKAAMSSLGDMTSAAAEHVIGFDGVAVIVNRSNPITTLSIQQVADLFSGRITDWGQVGGMGAVHVDIRDNNSGTRKFFERKVLKVAGAGFIPSAKQFETGNELSDAVAGDVGGIGFVGATSTGNAKVLALSVQSTGDCSQAYLPNGLTIRTQDYALSRRLFLYSLPNKSRPEVNQFLSFVDSALGQDIVGKSGFTPLTIAQAAPTASPCAPKEYSQATKASSRLTFNFNFQKGSSALDNLAVSDIHRLTDYIIQNKIDTSQLMLIGFTDNQGSDEINDRLSRERAEAVAEQLKGSGIVVAAIRGFGKAMPVATNDTDEGREHNRRVEIWRRP